MSVTQPGPTPDNEPGETSPWEQHPEIEKPVETEEDEDEEPSAFWPPLIEWHDEMQHYQETGELLPMPGQISQIVPQYAEKTGFCRYHKREK